MAVKKSAPPKAYLHVLMCVHPGSGKAIPIKTFDDETVAWEAAAAGNVKASHLQHHVKKIPKPQ